MLNNWWQRIKAWFLNSETVLWARLQVFVGILWVVLSQTDLSPILHPRLLTYWLIVSGIITEYMRRRGTTAINGTIVDKING